jgi:hypothetical protein
MDPRRTGCVAAVYVIRELMKVGQANAKAIARTNAAVAARADDGAKLMHYIDGGISEEIARTSHPSRRRITAHLARGFIGDCGYVGVCQPRRSL